MILISLSFVSKKLDVNFPQGIFSAVLCFLNPVLICLRYSVAPMKGQLESSKFHLTLLENLTDFHSQGKKLTDEDSTPVVDENVCLALDWDAKTPDSKVISKDLVCDIHESVDEKHSSEDNSCSLEECLKLYWNPENINKECGWRCDHCKDVRAATRKLMICKHPENVVIHLKRFSYTGNGRKISKHIQFPLRGLDMSPFTHPEITRDRAIYDLHAVCSHYGYMNFGHYIAFCKPYSEEELDAVALTNTDGWLRYDDSKVNNAKESEVEKTCAYILFYHRRKTASSCMKHTLEATSTESEDTSKAGHYDPQAMQESVETSEVATEQNTTLNNFKNTSILVKEQENNCRLSADCSSTNGETLLEDILD
ncbi:ubiquitin carboxyl-terminal hydrolase 19-like [Paramuricea clavata]|uniref:ubiquitinyl hydrolase 1 n=1 Tax=Paramuricea clavata TaxID=317549 RepID=A0A7D9DJC0_PARCT|nr:ubiquitin carboxyl-terminal hydrolase 19-like [Paramuricea clavata]